MARKQKPRSVRERQAARRRAALLGKALGAKEGIGSKMLTPFLGNDGHGTIPLENLNSSQ